MPYGSLQAGLGKGIGRIPELIRWVMEQRETKKQQDIENALRSRQVAVQEKQQVDLDETRRNTAALSALGLAPAGTAISPAQREGLFKGTPAELFLTQPNPEDTFPGAQTSMQFGTDLAPTGVERVPTPGLMKGWSKTIPTEPQQVRVAQIRAEAQLARDEKINTLRRYIADQTAAVTRARDMARNNIERQQVGVAMQHLQLLNQQLTALENERYQEHLEEAGRQKIDIAKGIPMPTLMEQFMAKEMGATAPTTRAPLDVTGYQGSPMPGVTITDTASKLPPNVRRIK